MSLLPIRCPLCRRPGAAPCPSCADRLQPAPVRAGVRALFALDDTGLALIAALKYRNARPVAARLGPAMGALVRADAPEVVTWVPTAAVRRRRRGYDQAELLARAVARSLGVPCRRLLWRQGSAVHQTGRSRTARLGDPPRFRAIGPVPAAVVVVDDVVTTGGSLGSAQRALAAAGARRIVLLAAAATP